MAVQCEHCTSVPQGEIFSPWCSKGMVGTEGGIKRPMFNLVLLLFGLFGSSLLRDQCLIWFYFCWGCLVLHY